MTKQVVENINRTKSEFDEQTLNSVLARKADMSDIERLNEMTASKKDTDDIIDSVKVVHQQLMHSIVLLNEAVKLFDDSHLNKQNKEKKVLNLVRQIQALAQWTNRADAMAEFQSAIKSDIAIMEKSTDSLIDVNLLEVSDAKSRLRAAVGKNKFYLQTRTG